MASDAQDSRRKHRHSPDDESAEESSKRRKHRHHHHHHRHRHRHRHISRKHDEGVDDKHEISDVANFAEATDAASLPPPPPSPPSVVVVNSKCLPDYDMEEGEIIEENPESDEIKIQEVGDESSALNLGIGNTVDTSDHGDQGAVAHDVGLSSGKIPEENGRVQERMEGKRSTDNMLVDLAVDRTDRKKQGDNSNNNHQDLVGIDREDGHSGRHIIDRNTEKVDKSSRACSSPGNTEEFQTPVCSASHATYHERVNTRNRSRSHERVRDRSRSCSVVEEVDADDHKKYSKHRADSSRAMHDSDDDMIVQQRKENGNCSNHLIRDEVREHTTIYSRYSNHVDDYRSQRSSHKYKEEGKIESKRDRDREPGWDGDWEMDGDEKGKVRGCWDMKEDRIREKERERSVDRYKRTEREQDVSRYRGRELDNDRESDRGRSRDRTWENEKVRDVERHGSRERLREPMRERHAERCGSRERPREPVRERDAERRGSRERPREPVWEREAERRGSRERPREPVREREAEWHGSRERAEEKERERARERHQSREVDRAREREKERGWDRERERERERERGWNSYRDGGRGRDNERDDLSRHHRYESGDYQGGDLRNYKTSSRHARHDETKNLRDRTWRNDSASNSFERGQEKLKRDEDEQEDYEEKVALQLVEQEEEDLNRIKEESRKRRQAILEKYNTQPSKQQTEAQLPEAKTVDPDKVRMAVQAHKDAVSGNHDTPRTVDGSSEGADAVVSESFSVRKSPGKNGFPASERTSGAAGLGEGTPKSERSGDMFCDDIFGESPAGVRKLGKGDGLPIERSGLHDNWDDAEGYYSYRFGEILDGRYEVTAAHGKGVFSTVVRAKDLKAGSGEPEEVAIKMIRNNDTMYKAGMQELVILKKLVGADPENRRHCVRFISHFKYRNHLCLVFESLHMNLREVLKKFGRNIGLKLTAVRAYSKQLFIALKHLKNCGVLHCDIKPDNMLVNDAKNVLKLCDFGNAMFAGKNEITPYLVSRFYRAPEIILGLPYDHPLDIWSVGCCLYELYTGKVLFPGPSNNDMLRLHMELKGPFPKKMLRKGAFIDQHYDQDLNFHATEEDPVTKKTINRLILNIKPKDIGTIITGFPGEDPKMVANFKDLLDKIFVLDPEKRLTVSQALSHPFITGK